MYGHASAPEKETCAASPRLAEAFAANNNCSTAQDCLAFGFPLNFSGANPSNATSYAGCTATNCPCRCVESSVISNPQPATVPRISSQYVLLSAARFKSNSRASQQGICTPLYPSFAAHAAMLFKLLNGAASPANCARKIPGPLIVLIVPSAPHRLRYAFLRRSASPRETLLYSFSISKQISATAGQELTRWIS